MLCALPCEYSDPPGGDTNEAHAEITDCEGGILLYLAGV